MRHLIAGLILLAFGAWGIIAWWEDFGEVLRGAIPFMLVLFGLVAIGAGFQRTSQESMKEDESLREPGASPVAYHED